MVIPDVANAETPRLQSSVELLSAVAAMISASEAEDASSATDATVDTFDSDEGKLVQRSRSRSGSISRSFSRSSLSRSLSRTFSTRNLQQFSEIASSSSEREPDEELRPRRKPPPPEPLRMGKKRRRLDENSAPARFLPCAPLPPSTPVATNTASHTKRSFANQDTDESVSAKDESTPDYIISRSPTDEVRKNVYRSYQMPLPDDQLCAGVIYLPKPTTTSSHKSTLGRNRCNSIISHRHYQSSKDKTKHKMPLLVDDYNYEIAMGAPLLHPPRLPSVLESITITERSLEEKSRWGWYVS